MLVIKDLDVKIEDKSILQGFSLEVGGGEVHAIMGPNGAGKSTLAKVIGGHPGYEVTGGQIEFDGQDLCDLEPEERAALGLFIGFQYPVEISGVTNLQFLHAASRTSLSEEEFEKKLDEKMKLIGVDPSFKKRFLNEGFSGGEKKRNEILQMAVLEPVFAILDETDSGLDIDALKEVAQGIKKLRPKKGLILITHYQRLLDHVKPDRVHIMADGKIVESGGPELALRLEEKGYAGMESLNR